MPDNPAPRREPDDNPYRAEGGEPSSGDDLRTAVIDFIAKELRTPHGRLTEDTKLMGNLGVDGDDGVEFMEAFGRRFGVDMTECIPVKHFGPECIHPLFPIYWLYLLLDYLIFRPNLAPEERAGLIPIRVGDLVAAAATQS